MGPHSVNHVVWRMRALACEPSILRRMPPHDFPSIDASTLKSRTDGCEHAQRAKNASFLKVGPGPHGAHFHKALAPPPPPPAAESTSGRMLLVPVTMLLHPLDLGPAVTGP